MLIVAASVKMIAQPITCDFFCATNMNMDTDTSLKVSIFMKGEPPYFIHYPHVSAITNTNGDTLAMNNMEFFGHIGGTSQDYTAYTKGTSLPSNFKGMVYLKYYYYLWDSIFVVQTCPLVYPCLSTGTESDFSSTEIRVYPVPLNPASPLRIDGIIPPNAYFRVFDLTGREVEQKPIVSSSLQLDKGNLPEGMYMYVIGDNKTIFKTGKLVVSYQMEQ